MAELNVEKQVVVGQKLDLTKEAGEAGLTKIRVELGWDVNPNAAGAQFDADATVILTKSDEKTTSDNVAYFGQLATGNGAVVHQGDNLTGQGDGADEIIKVDLSKVTGDLVKAIIYVTIYEAVSRGQNFGMLNNAFVQIVNDETGEVLCKLELDFDADTATSIRFGSLINRNGAWFFSAEKIAVEGGIKGVIDTHVV